MGVHTSNPHLLCGFEVSYVIPLSVSVFKDYGICSAALRDVQSLNDHCMLDVLGSPLSPHLLSLWTELLGAFMESGLGLLDFNSVFGEFTVECDAA